MRPKAFLLAMIIFLVAFPLTGCASKEGGRSPVRVGGFNKASGAEAGVNILSAIPELLYEIGMAASRSSGTQGLYKHPGPTRQIVEEDGVKEVSVPK